MKRMDTSLPLISMELEANKACRQNNSMILCNENCDPKLGGNIDIYQQSLGNRAKSVQVEEFTYSGWSGTALDLIILNMLNEFERNSPEPPCILSNDFIRLGISFQAH